jgi:hypothetical protein
VCLSACLPACLPVFMSVCSTSMLLFHHSSSNNCTAFTTHISEPDAQTSSGKPILITSLADYFHMHFFMAFHLETFLLLVQEKL